MRAVVALLPLAVAALAPVAMVACDDLNKPLAHPNAEPRRTCFSEVECPSSMKCVKGPQDIEGRCLPRTAADDAGGPPTTTDDGGASTPGPAPAPAPTVTAAPGDIQI